MGNSGTTGQVNDKMTSDLERVTARPGAGVETDGRRPVGTDLHGNAEATAGGAG